MGKLRRGLTQGLSPGPRCRAYATVHAMQVHAPLDPALVEEELKS